MARILALDLGTSQLKLLVMDENATVECVIVEAYPTYTPYPGWLEQNPDDWCAALLRGLEKLAQRLPLSQIDVISFSGHMSGVVMLNERGDVLHPCILLADTRSEAQAKRLAESMGSLVREKTGNPIINAFSLPKLCWLKEHRPDVYAQTTAWVAPKDYLRYCLTGQIATEYTDAYNSLCLNKNTAQWDVQIIEEASLCFDKFPPVLAPTAHAGTVSAQAACISGLKQSTAVIAGGADMACGAVGTCLFENGDTALTLGTCATFLTMVPHVSDAGYGAITYHMHALPHQFYALGSHFNGGFAVNWFSQAHAPAQDISHDFIATLAKEAEQVPCGSGGVLTLPFLSGSGSPYFRAQDRQNIFGINAATTRGALFRSQLEGISYNLKEVYDLYCEIVPDGLANIRLGGGGCKIPLWPQMLSDVFGAKFVVCKNADASTIGAALLGGYGAGIFDDLSCMSKQALTIERTLTPRPQAHACYEKLYQTYQSLYNLMDEWNKQ